MSLLYFSVAMASCNFKGGSTDRTGLSDIFAEIFRGVLIIALEIFPGLSTGDVLVA